MKLYLFLLAFLAISCSSPAANRVTENPSPSAEPTSTEPEVDFPTFLAEFARVLEKSENQKLNQMVAEKLAVWGREDQDPKLELTYIDRIIKVVEVYEMGGIYDSETDRTVSYKELFANEALLKKNISGSEDERRVEDFVFNKDQSGQWKLTLVYWDTKRR